MYKLPLLNHKIPQRKYNVPLLQYYIRERKVRAFFAIEFTHSDDLFSNMNSFRLVIKKFAIGAAPLKAICTRRSLKHKNNALFATTPRSINAFKCTQHSNSV